MVHLLKEQSERRVGAEADLAHPEMYDGLSAPSPVAISHVSGTPPCNLVLGKL